MTTLLIIVASLLLVTNLLLSVLLIRRTASLRSQNEELKSDSQRTATDLGGRIATLETIVGERDARIVELNTATLQREQTIDQLRKQNTDYAARIAALEVTVEKGIEKSTSDKAELEKLQASFRVEFRNLAGDILQEKSEQFKLTNSESINTLLKPFRDNITDFRERIEHIYTQQNQEQGSLRNELRNLVELNQRITRETTNLTEALKGNSKVQGDFGEMILETILDQSNLKRGIHYLIQESFKNEEGRNSRPDVVLRLPDKKAVIIDSKVSLTAYVEAVGATDQATRDAALVRHVNSVRNHIKELSVKNYQDLVDSSPDFVIMFIANEGAFMAALQSAPELWGEAYNRKIIVSSPTNLFALLKIVDDLWKRDNQSRNALEIAKAGGLLYDKIASFVDTLTSVDKSIKKASSDCDKALEQLSRGRGNILTRTERMREMGVKASKRIDSALLEQNTPDGND